MLIVSDEFVVLPKIVDRFGLAVPANPRLLVRVDGKIGVDSSYEPDADPLAGLGFAYNLTPIGLNTRHSRARRVLERYLELMVDNPGRGAVHLYNAAYEEGYPPYLLPPQWCVCSPIDLDSRHLWSNAVVLHVGHPDVIKRYEKGHKDRSLRKQVKHVLKRWS